MLGATQEQIIAIEKAKALGLYVITCDNRPDNPGHALADESYNVSITDKEAVLALAQRLKVDAVICYALEAGVEAAAFAQEQMGRPTPPYESVKILSNKKLFRSFLQTHGFATPETYEVSSFKLQGSVFKPNPAPLQGRENPSEADSSLFTHHSSLIVKPTDMWGSRGVCLVEREEDLQQAIDEARKNSRSGNIIIEEYISGTPLQCDAFSVDGILTSCLWSDVFYDRDCANPLIPVAGAFPSECRQEVIRKVNDEVQRLITLLHMGTSPYNIEVMLSNDNIYIMEMAPRNGGNGKSHLIELATGVDFITGAIKASLGMDCSDIIQRPSQGHWLSYALHKRNNEPSVPSAPSAPSVPSVPSVGESAILSQTPPTPPPPTTLLSTGASFVTIYDRNPGPFRSTRDTAGLIIQRFDDRQSLNEAIKGHSINNRLYL